MEWQLVLMLIGGGFLVLLLLGLPVAVAFLSVNILGVYLFMGGTRGLEHFILELYMSIASFSLVPIPLFILMGDVLFRAGIAVRVIDTLDQWLGRVPGRLSLLAIGGGTLFATISGVNAGGVALLGSVLAPEMERRGYHKSMTFGPIMGGGVLATMIPPSALAIILAWLLKTSVGGLLIAIIIPGLLMSGLFAAYIFVRAYLQPSLAPPYIGVTVPLRQRGLDFARYILPLGSIVFLVVGLIFLGIATPTEAAALGAAGCFVLAACYGKLNRKNLVDILRSTVRTTGMLLLILVGARAFSELMAFTGVTRGVTNAVLSFAASPIEIILIMMLVLLVMGCFIETLSISLVTIPIFLPIIQATGIDVLWFAVLMLTMLETGGLTPPFGLTLFVMKGVSPPDTRMKDIYSSALPFIALICVVVVLVAAFPGLALWLPGLMR